MNPELKMASRFRNTSLEPWVLHRDLPVEVPAAASQGCRDLPSPASPQLHACLGALSVGIALPPSVAEPLPGCSVWRMYFKKQNKTKTESQKAIFTFCRTRVASFPCDSPTGNGSHRPCCESFLCLKDDALILGRVLRERTQNSSPLCNCISGEAEGVKAHPSLAVSPALTP